MVRSRGSNLRGRAYVTEHGGFSSAQLHPGGGTNTWLGLNRSNPKHETLSALATCILHESRHPSAAYAVCPARGQRHGPLAPHEELLTGKGSQRTSIPLVPLLAPLSTLERNNKFEFQICSERYVLFSRHSPPTRSHRLVATAVSPPRVTSVSRGRSTFEVRCFATKPKLRGPIPVSLVHNTLFCRFSSSCTTLNCASTTSFPFPKHNRAIELARESAHTTISLRPSSDHST